MALKALAVDITSDATVVAALEVPVRATKQNLNNPIERQNPEKGKSSPIPGTANGEEFNNDFQQPDADGNNPKKGLRLPFKSKFKN